MKTHRVLLGIEPTKSKILTIILTTFRHMNTKENDLIEFLQFSIMQAFDKAYLAN